MDPSPSPLQASSSRKGKEKAKEKEIDEKSLLIRSLSTIIHHTSSSTTYAKIAGSDDSQGYDHEDEWPKLIIDGVALLFDSGESGDAAAVTAQVVSCGILLDVVKSSNKHASVPQGFTLRKLPPESELDAQLQADWATFILKWTRFALTPSLHVKFIQSLATRIHPKSPQSSRKRGKRHLERFDRERQERENVAFQMQLYVYYFCEEKIRQRLGGVIPLPATRSGKATSAPRLRFRNLFFRDTPLIMQLNGDVDFESTIPDDALSEVLRLVDDKAFNVDRYMPSYLRRVNESWLAATIHHLLPDRNIQLFNRCLVLDEGLIDVVLHLLVGILAEIQYYIDKLETMLATEDLSRDIEGNRAQMLGCLSEFPRLFHTLLQMIRESPTCWRIVRCLSKVFEDRIVAATTGEFENTAQDLDDIGSLVNESDDNVDYGSPDAPIYEKVWTWLESLTDWAFILHHICSLDGGIGDHLRRGLTIRLWAPELREPIKQASLENTLAFVNWDPEEDRSLEALQNAALTHWNKTAVDPSSTADDHRPVFSISQRILLGLEDKSRWPNAFQGSIHCQGLLACLIKDQIIKARLMATSRRRCTCCNLLLRFIEPDMELSMASSGSKPLPWALPLEECLPEEIKDAILKALAIRLKQVLWAVGTDERRKAVETSSRVVTAKYVTLRKRSETRNTEE